MFQDQPNHFKKTLVFLFLALIGTGVFIFWLATLKYTNLKQIGQKGGQDLKNITELWQKSEPEQRPSPLLSSLKNQITPPSPENKIIKEITQDETQVKQGLALTLLDIVLGDQQTWAYLHLKNQNNARVLLRSNPQSEIKIIQDGEEFPETDTKKITDYPLKDILESEEEVIGALHFPAIDPEKPFILFINGLKIEGAEEYFNFLFKIE